MGREEQPQHRERRALDEGQGPKALMVDVLELDHYDPANYPSMKVRARRP